MVIEKDVLPRSNQENTPGMDEGWWESVMSDEVFVEETSSRSPSKQQDLDIEENNLDWIRVQNLFENDEVVKLRVSGFNRGGLLVQGFGIYGFVPVSHLVDFCDADGEEERKEKLSQYSGNFLHLKVIECQPSLDRIVLSERAAQSGEGSRKKLFQNLKNGEIITGIVTNITDFGVFVDLGGVEGLIHVSELSWGRVQHPNEVLQIGAKVNAVVLKICMESSRVALSLKRLYPNPWEKLLEKYSSGDIVDGTITSIMRFGVFARIEEGVEGLIHVSSIDLLPNQGGMNDILKIGQTIKVEILHIDINRRRLGLALYIDKIG